MTVNAPLPHGDRNPHPPEHLMYFGDMLAAYPTHILVVEAADRGAAWRINTGAGIARPLRNFLGDPWPPEDQFYLRTSELNPGFAAHIVSVERATFTNEANPSDGGEEGPWPS